MSFGHLKNLNVAEKTARFEIPILGEAVLIVKPATEANKPFFNAALKGIPKQVSRPSKQQVTQKQLDASRENDRKLYPQHVIVGWERVTDDQGAEVAFSVDECQMFIDELINHAPWIFDDLRIFANNPTNFIDVMDIEVRSKN